MTKRALTIWSEFGRLIFTLAVRNVAVSRPTTKFCELGSETLELTDASL